MKGRFLAVAAAAVCYLLSHVQAADSPTALALAKEGNRYVGEQAKDKVVQIRSDKSVGSLTPNVWYVVFYDHTATFKTVEMKFGAGKMLDVKRPLRVIETITSSDKTIDLDKVKIDSDKAIEIATKEPLLENLKVQSTRAKLQNSDSGAVWTVELWAQKLRKPSDTVSIGEVTITADEGKVIKNQLDISKVD